jgi:c-di-GMP phosphodiesterase
MKPYIDTKVVEDIFKRSSSLAIKLLRFINSAALRRRREVTSIRQAVLLLGPKMLAKWLSVILLSRAGENKPGEILRQAVIRARFCELVAELAGMKNDQEYYMCGLLSMSEAIFDQPLESILSNLPLGQNITDALLGKKGKMYTIMLLVEAIERGNWSKSAILERHCSLDKKTISFAIYDAIKWADEII